MADIIEKNLQQGTKLLMKVAESFPGNFQFINTDSAKLSKDDMAIKNSLEYSLYQQIVKEEVESISQWRYFYMINLSN